MAGKRKAEGIALLSVYAGSDDDDDAASQSSDEEQRSPRRNVHDGGSQSLTVDVSGRNIVLPVSALGAGVRVPAGGLGIVDYAHDEAAASPEPEEDVDVDSDGVRLDIELQVDNGNLPGSPNGVHALTPSRITTPTIENDVDFPGVIEEIAGIQEIKQGEEDEEQEQIPTAMEYDILNDFLPPLPPAKYSEELQSKFAKYLALKKTGKSLNEQLRNTKGYRNPDFLQRAVKYHEIDQIGSCFTKDVFDPHGFDAADYYDALALEQRREADRKEQERKQSQSQRVDFVRGGIQTAVGVAKPTLPLIHKVVTVTTTSETLKVDTRSSKKSKWDKVELEGRSAQSIAADAMAVANVHAALLSASANAGAGYASFAQQRRREAEEKLRATEKNALMSSNSSKVERKTDTKSLI